MQEERCGSHIAEITASKATQDAAATASWVLL